MIYLISYDLKKEDKDYSGLFDVLKSFPDWWHYLESTWLIKTDKTPKEILEMLKPHIDNDDYLLIIEAGKKHNGRFPKKAWDWIKRKENR